MQELLLVLNIAVYLGLGYVVMIGLVWLITRDSPELWIYRDWAIKLVAYVLAPLGIRFVPQNSRPEVREAFKREDAKDSALDTGEPNQFKSVRAAKEYIVSRIVAEAEREGVPLTEVERKMLYFSETGWTLPGILKVNEEFERDYDQGTYEQKIAGLVQGLEDNAAGEEQESWDDAVLKLCEGDHYLLVLIGAGERLQQPKSPVWRKLKPWLPSLNAQARREPLDVLRLFVVALVIFVSIILFATLTTHR
jgi:hypothetical protein